MHRGNVSWRSNPIASEPGGFRKLSEFRFCELCDLREPKFLENRRAELNFLWQELISSSARINYALGSFQLYRLELMRSRCRVPEFFNVPKDRQKRYPARKLN